jgi:hypothetical protein
MMNPTRIALFNLQPTMSGRKREFRPRPRGTAIYAYSVVLPLNSSDDKPSALNHERAYFGMVRLAALNCRNFVTGILISNSLGEIT